MTSHCRRAQPRVADRDRPVHDRRVPVAHLQHLVPGFPEPVLLLRGRAVRRVGLAVPERLRYVPGGHVGEGLRQVADQTACLPGTDAEAVVLLPEREEAVVRAGTAVADLGEERPVVAGQGDAVPCLECLDDGDGQRRVELVLMDAGAEDLPPRIPSGRDRRAAGGRRLCRGARSSLLLHTTRHDNGHRRPATRWRTTRPAGRHRSDHVPIPERLARFRHERLIGERSNCFTTA